VAELAAQGIAKRKLATKTLFGFFMAIVEYTPELFDDLQEMVMRMPPNMNLAHRPFVDYYYASRSWCKLYLFLSDSGRVLGTLGRELLRFEYESREINIRMGSNWFSFQPGVGGQLAKFSAQANPNSFGMMLMASQKALKVLRHYGWIRIPGVIGYFLNGCTLYPRGRCKAAANSMMRQFIGNRIPSLISRIPPDVSERMTICEEFCYAPDLLPRQSPFKFRFAPTVEYLNWRYNLSLSFVRYRLFRILVTGTSLGYVIINESPQQIMVAQCDGEDATALAYGILLAILQVGETDQKPRTVFLSCSYLDMQQVFEQFGFRPRLKGDLPFAFRTLPPNFDPSLDTSKWLVNYDWSDNGLQAPFLDERVVS
jgi:hypothetical protein